MNIIKIRIKYWKFHTCSLSIDGIKKSRKNALIWKRNLSSRQLTIIHKKLNFVLQQNPLCSPDLAPSDFFKFSNLKRLCTGVCTERKSYRLYICTQYTDAYFNSLPNFLEKLKKLLEKCPQLKGDLQNNL